MPIQISTHVFKHYDTVMEDTIALQQMIESSATTAGANHHYFFIGEQHSANVDIQRREALASRIEYLDNITRVVERGMALDSEKGVVKEADLTSGPFAPARNVGLAKQIIEANAKSRNRVTVIFCGSDHDVRIKEQIVVAYQSDPTFRSAAWVSVGPTPAIPPSAVLRMKSLADLCRGKTPVGYVAGRTPSEKSDLLSMSRGEVSDVCTLRIYAGWTVKDCVTLGSQVFEIYINEDGRRASVLAEMNRKGGDAAIQFVSTTGVADFLLMEVPYSKLPEPDYS